MAFENYTDLETRVESWVNRTDLNVDEYATLVEKDIEKLELVRQEESVELVAVGGLLDLPTDFIKAKSLVYHASGGDVTLKIASKNTVLESRGQGRTVPTRFSRLGNQIILNAECDDDEFTLYYYKKLDSIVTNVTNWLLELYPQVYFFGCMAYAFEFVQDNDKALYWRTKYDKEAVMLDTNERASQYSGGDLEVEPNPYMESNT